LNESNGNYIRTIHPLDNSQVSFNDVISIDTNTIVVSTGTCIIIINIDTHNILHKIQSNSACYGITHCDGKLYYWKDWKGIQRFDLKTNPINS
jgi:alkyl hydroperoxide reductase subunit AhpF